MAWIDFNLFNLVRVNNLTLGDFHASAGCAWITNPPQTITGAVTGSCRANVSNQGQVDATYYLSGEQAVFVSFTCKVNNDRLTISTFSSSTDYKVEKNYIDKGNNEFLVNIDYRPAAG